MSADRVTWVIPCYNEADRLDAELVAQLVASDHVSALFVNDGSKDDTQALLDRLADAHPGSVDVIELPRNAGKAEAVRQGLVAAAGAPETTIVGYLDADFATPPDEAERMLEIFVASGKQVAMGARVRRLGANIDRAHLRHYLGRIFATVASLSLQLPVYDTQCGAKLFRVGPELRGAIAAAFDSRWVFDVDLIGRLLDAGLTAEDFIEVPLLVWHDVGGSKLTGRAMLSAGKDLLALAYRRIRTR